MRYKIIETEFPDHPYALVNEAGTVVRMDYKPEVLSNWAFAHGDASHVRFELKDPAAAENVPWKR